MKLIQQYENMLEDVSTELQHLIIHTKIRDLQEDINLIGRDQDRGYSSEEDDEYATDDDDDNNQNSIFNDPSSLFFYGI